MADVEEPKKLESEIPSDPSPPPTEAAVEKSVTPPPPTEEKPADSTEKPPEPIEKAAESTEKKSTEVSVDRDAVLARVATEKRISLINAWEESEKSKAENKAQKKLSSIAAWENTKKAAIEAELKRIEEKLDKQKAEYVEKMKNKAALIHKEAEEKKAIVEAKRGEDVLKAEELAAKYRATGTTPNKTLGCC
ncbi:hypothetical protein ES332_A08G116500v1 [Gossypium tomentosum]|uniref:Remorin C-terminal domain-containing protein n=1 Tax=Gossypium tomentosum TaxID=34277 RepID=A0A5D2PEP0_GOSTO|nr:hypothetical protein ES332_A08G116500v1 [Gossypium tomentosum]